MVRNKLVCSGTRKSCWAPSYLVGLVFLGTLSCGELAETDNITPAPVNSPARSSDSDAICGCMAKGNLCEPIAVGAKTPFRTLEAEGGQLVGGAQVHAFRLPIPAGPTLETEASGNAYVELKTIGDAIIWENPVPCANTIVVRSSIPDTPDGKGRNATIALYVNSVFRQHIQLSSKQSWVYSIKKWSNDPQDGDPRHFYNEDLAWIDGDPIPHRAKVELRIDENSPNLEYAIDCIDLEYVGPPQPKPSDALSVVTDCEADNTGAVDSQAAIQNCVSQARRENKSVYIPPGRYLVNSQQNSECLDFSGVTVAGAGMWHTTLYRKKPIESNARSYVKVGTNTVLRDLSIDSNAITRLRRGLGKADYGILAKGENWLVQRVWVRHCDAQWMSGTDGLIRDSRVGDSWGDGINLNNSNKKQYENGKLVTRGKNLQAKNNFVRGCGDDGFATFSDAGKNGQNTQMEGTRFEDNTSIASYWANALRVAGGKNVVVQNNFCAASSSRAMAIGIYGETGQPLESATIKGNYLVGAGWGNLGGYGMHLFSHKDRRSVVDIENNVIEGSPRDGILIEDKQKLTLTNNRIVDPGRHGIRIHRRARGRATLSGNEFEGLKSRMSQIKNEAGGRFTVAYARNELNIQGDNGEPVSAFPLGLCQGDCDTDSDCEPGLKCFERNGTQAVPGCRGTGVAGKDYCYAPSLTMQGDNGEPASAFPLGLCQGDCDTDSDCEPGLKCFERDGTQAVPGCRGTGVAGKDYCYVPSLTMQGDNGEPASAFPLGLCQGDCDTDSDCEPGLKCFERDGTQAVPGCRGTGVSGKDYCYHDGGGGGDGLGPKGFEFSGVRYMTIAVSPDQQMITKNFPMYQRYLMPITRFTAQKKNGYNIKALLNVGDMVQVAHRVPRDGHKSQQSRWDRMLMAVHHLANASIPFIPACGNHDGCANNYGRISDFNAQFTGEPSISDPNVRRFNGLEPEPYMIRAGLHPLLEDHHSNDAPSTGVENALYRIRGAGMEFIVLSLQFARGLTRRALWNDWAHGVLDSNANTPAIILSHDLWFSDHVEAMCKHPNVFLALQGHRHGDRRRVLLDCAKLFPAGGFNHTITRFALAYSHDNSDEYIDAEASVVRFFTFFRKNGLNRVCFDTYSYRDGAWLTTTGGCGDGRGNGNRMHCETYCWSNAW